MLSAGSISIELKRFTEDSFPREFLSATGISFSAWGTPNSDGTSYAPKCLWNLVVLATRAEAEMLARLEVISRRQNLRLIDTLDRLWEVGAPTRAIAPGTTAIASDGQVGYFAQFECRMTAPIKQSADGKFRVVTLQLTETDKVLP